MTVDEVVLIGREHPCSRQDHSGWWAMALSQKGLWTVV